jgi:hypothetical protein
LLVAGAGAARLAGVLSVASLARSEGAVPTGEERIGSARAAGVARLVAGADFDAADLGGAGFAAGAVFPAGAGLPADAGLAAGAGLAGAGFAGEALTDGRARAGACVPAGVPALPFAPPLIPVRRRRSPRHRLSS